MSIQSHSGIEPENAALIALGIRASAAESLPPKWLLWDLALMILLSAFLLFQVQPLISKFILPWFGGSPAVWTTCMLFFQCLLFCGYAYAHLTSRLLSCRGQAILHLALIAVAMVLLPIAPDASWKPKPGMEPTWRILGLLAVSVGVPYFVLSATGPLGQAWFSRAYAQRSPYRLYSLSNVGSLAALLTFPVVFEPAFAADTQAWLWSAAFVAFGLLCAGVAVWIWRNRGDCHARHDAPSTATDGPKSAAADEPRLGRRALWLVLPACASLMFLATTNHVCQDVAVVPFLWVVPLALYLLSFIICFDHERWYRRGPFAATTAICVFLSAGGSSQATRWLSAEIPARFSAINPDTFNLRLSFIQELALYFATLLLICMMCHGELVRLRPKPRFLTEYYLFVAAGGALGGIFVSLIAPRIFRSFLEWNFGLVMSFIAAAILGCMALGFVRPRRGGEVGEANSAIRQPMAFTMLWRGCAVGLLAAGLFLVAKWQLEGAIPPQNTIYQRRNFYGIVRVEEISDVLPIDCAPDMQRHFRQFISGRIRHGRQWIDDNPQKRRQPTSYYAKESGVGRALTYFQNKKDDMRIGVVGLGVGTLASYADKPTRYIKFYEINPEVEHIANTYFTYLTDCQGRHEIVMGDARLSMENEAPQHFDVLVLDAFSGDAPPVHLLTKEAFAVYKKHLSAGGIIAVNIKNNYVDLAPVVRGAANRYGYKTTRIWTEGDPTRLMYPVDYMLLTSDGEFLQANPPILKAGAHAELPPVLWTDHYSNLFELLMRD